MGLFDSLKDIVTANQQMKADAKTSKQSKESRQQGLDLVGNMNWEPELTSDHVAPYQRSQSPVADSFLESMLTGQNPAAVQGTRLGADRAKAAATQGFNQSYGGFDALRQRQAAVRQATPWAVKPFDQPAITQDDKRGVQAPGLAKYGITPEDAALLAETGVTLDPVTGRNTNTKLAMTVGGAEGNKNIWGVTLGPPEYKRMADALRTGDRALVERIMKGQA